MGKKLNNYEISFWLDQRRIKDDGSCTVKLKIYFRSERKRKIYSTPFSFTPKRFDSIWKAPKPRGANKEEKEKLRLYMSDVDMKAKAVFDKYGYLDLDQLEFMLFGKKKRIKYNGLDLSSLKNQYIEAMDELKSNGRIGNYGIYQNSIKSFEAYCVFQKKNFPQLKLHDINEKWLNGYTKYMTNNGRSATTISMYLRTLRTVYNKAISEKLVAPLSSPFKEGRFKIPSTSANKRALTLDQIKALYKAVPENDEQKKAKDFWYLSFLLSGMNMKDILMLRVKDIKSGMIEYTREKTKNTSNDKKKIPVHISPKAQAIIDKYSTGAKDDDLLFNTLEGIQDNEKRYNKIKNFTRFVNQHIKPICASIGLPLISTYWARHSFASIANKNGVSLIDLRDMLGHSTVKVTENYIQSISHERTKVVNNNMDNILD